MTAVLLGGMKGEGLGPAFTDTSSAPDEEEKDLFILHYVLIKSVIIS